MGRFLEKFKDKSKNVGQRIDKVREVPINKRPKLGPRYSEKEDKINSFHSPMDDDFDDFNDDLRYNDPFYDEVNIQTAQKPESFHHFILENKYQDLERSIRGYKDVYDKSTREWRVVRKQEHCFTDEEAEEIIRTAQSHLSTDIKLSLINTDSFGHLMDTIYEVLEDLFDRISEYRYGRYGSYERQGKMKEMNLKIFLELWTRIEANYSRAIGGSENKATHTSVKGQESLQSTDRDVSDRFGGYS